jgi:putative ABC transport system ATP-binding protein
MGNDSFAVRVLDVKKSYGGDGSAVEALRGVSLDVERGSFVSIVGPSGSGKSTLLHCVAALDRPSSGEILVSGQRLSELDEEAATIFRRRRIGVVFQFFNLLADLSVEDNVAVPLMLDRMRRAEVRARVAAALEVVALRHRATHLPSELSGGEMQRAAIARALAMEPDLILADEPTGNLDSTAGERVLAELRRACNERRQTVVLVTHDMNAASKADRIIQLRDGRVFT